MTKYHFLPLKDYMQQSGRNINNTLSY